MTIACAKPSFTESFQHLSIGGGIAMSILIVCVTVVVIAFLVLLGWILKNDAERS